MPDYVTAREFDQYRETTDCRLEDLEAESKLAHDALVIVKFLHSKFAWVLYVVVLCGTLIGGASGLKSFLP